MDFYFIFIQSIKNLFSKINGIGTDVALKQMNHRARWHRRERHCQKCLLHQAGCVKADGADRRQAEVGLSVRLRMQAAAPMTGRCWRAFPTTGLAWGNAQVAPLMRVRIPSRPPFVQFFNQ